MNLSKSKYVSGKRCEKLLWLGIYKKEESEDSNENVLINGNMVGEYARKLFGDYILIKYDENDISNMINETNKYLKDKPNIICEASFSYDNNFCSVDILKNDEDGVEIYEVKSSTEIHESYIYDASYQTWVLSKLGLNVKKTSIVYLNNKYIKNGNLELNKLFIIEDISNLIDIDNIEEEVSKYKKIINSKEEPNNDLSLNCMKNKKFSYDCPFFKYCIKHLPKPNVFDVGCYTHFDKKLEKYYENKITFKDLVKEDDFNKNAMEQIEFELNDLKPKINKENIKSFLNTITYPIYFLDFESYQSVIPTIDGTNPYRQICFQYSLHYYLKENSDIKHTEFLSDDYEGNPMYGLCKKLCEDIPKDSCVIVYNQSFEMSRLKEMAELFPEFKDHLLNINDNIIDLFPVFRNHDYYVKEMEGSSSIKKVLPALFPNDSNLDYHNLKQVHKGDEASMAFLSLKDLSKEEEKELRYNMLEYCKLDTLAMVKIYDRLLEVVNE